MVSCAASRSASRLAFGFAMIAESIERRGRNGVDGVGPDQFFDVQHVAITGILGAGAGPQQPLRLRALSRQLLPMRAGEISL